MKPVRLRLAAGALALVATLPCAALSTLPAQAAPVPLSSVIGPSAVGTWRTQDGTEISIAPCGDHLCGSLSYIVIPKNHTADCQSMDHLSFGSLMLDYSNPDKSLQTRPLLGLDMMQVKPTGDPNTYTASIYNPQDGSTNDVEVFILNGGTTLRIGGACMGTMCAVTQDWPKVPDRPDAPTFAC